MLKASLFLLASFACEDRRAATPPAMPASATESTATRPALSAAVPSGSQARFNGESTAPVVAGMPSSMPAPVAGNASKAHAGLRRAKSTAPEPAPDDFGKDDIVECGDPVMIRFAKDPHSSEFLLNVLAQCEDDKVRLAVAENRTTSDAILWPLSRDPEAKVRLAVAKHSKTSGVVLGLLSEDLDTRVRSAVALNPTTSERFLWKLSKDPDVGVRSAAARNPKAAAALREPEKMEKKYLEYKRPTAQPK